jgi:hypothetical protein
VSVDRAELLMDVAEGCRVANDGALVGALSLLDTETLLAMAGRLSSAPGSREPEVVPERPNRLRP